MNAQTIKHGLRPEAGKPRDAGVEVIVVTASAVDGGHSFRSTASPGPAG